MSGLESMALTTIGSALALVYQAYTKIKTNKERCKVLYDQCLLLIIGWRHTLRDMGIRLNVSGCYSGSLRKCRGNECYLKRMFE